LADEAKSRQNTSIADAANKVSELISQHGIK
jgi:hypothetical protein